jgi:hypothetical protein
MVSDEGFSLSTTPSSAPPTAARPSSPSSSSNLHSLDVKKLYFYRIDICFFSEKD